MKLFTSLLFISILCFPFAQKLEDYSIGHRIPYYSNELGEQRMLNIYLPIDFSADSLYEVVYLLDGSKHEDFLHVVGLFQFFELQFTLPKTIVVGIENVDRKRDFTFPTTITELKAAFPTTGGSEKFIAFLEKELQPFIKANYSKSDKTYLLGQSLGGLLATEILLTKPHLFSHYFITSPSLWWDNQSLFKKIDAQYSALITAKTYVHITVGKEGKVMERDAKNLGSQLRKLNNKNLTIDFTFLPKEDHATILHNSLYNCLQTLFPKKKW